MKISRPQAQSNPKYPQLGSKEGVYPAIHSLDTSINPTGAKKIPLVRWG